MSTSVERSAKTVGVVSEMLSKTLMIPDFSATNTRPSSANRSEVGRVIPVHTFVSLKPLRVVDAAANWAPFGGVLVEPVVLVSSDRNRWAGAGSAAATGRTAATGRSPASRTMVATTDAA